MSYTPKNLYQFNDQNYYFELALINSKGDSFIFNNSAIEELIIEDDIFNFFSSGSLILNNRFNVIERSYKDIDGKLIKGYEFGTTNRDYIIFKCVPLYSDDTPQDELDSNVWELNHVFTIYDSEDIQGVDPEDKYKKLYFWDSFYELFLEKNIHFSTSLLNQDNIPASQRPDQNRKAFTGDIIKEIIKRTLSNEEKFAENKKNFNKWNRGRDSLFYTSHPQNKAIDDLNYVMKYHLSDEEFNNDPCILSRDRYTKEWSLIPYSQFFDKAINSINSSLPSTLQLESFVISDYGSSKNNELNKKRNRVPDNGGNPNLKLNMHFSDYSLIDKYELYDMTLMDKFSYLNTHVVHSYDYKNKTFLIKQKDSNIMESLDHFKENYSDKLNFEDFKNLPLFNVDNIRKSNINIKNIFSSGYSIDNNMISFGRNKILRNSLFLNTSIQFESRGLTSRKSGHFVSISKDSHYEESSYEAKLQGQWFLTRVVHRFTSDTYTNNMFGVKINKFEIENE